jgi:hypothetical protein
MNGQTLFFVFPILVLMTEFVIVMMYISQIPAARKTGIPGMFLFPVAVLIWCFVITHYDSIHDKIDHAGHPMFSMTPIYFLTFIISAILAAVPYIMKGSKDD